MTTPRNSIHSPTQGFTLLELLVVMAILGILFGFGMWSYRSAQNPAREVSRGTHAALIQLRADAVANTQARRMILTNGGDLQFQSGATCAATTWTETSTVPLADLDPQSRVSLTLASPTFTAAQTKVVACFSSRGQASASSELQVRAGTRAYVVEVALGGAVRTRGL
ncbi:type II secretion system protein [Deinococcus sp. A31D244]|uniref:type II secretion system protein n=1 Tax=Deinococcus sp. A31D244 TaxID=3397675 RepID=UPI0039DF9F5E